MKSKDLTNQKFGRLLVVSKSFSKNDKVYWECLCDCGNKVFVSTSNLKCNKTKSCGCFKSEMLSERNIKHNQRNTKLYEIWKSIKQRCLNTKNQSYHNYGGRGIKICNEWLNDYNIFYNWSMENGYKEGLTIDRIDVNGNYEPSNCRWVTRLIQCNNTRVNRYVTINNETKTLADWCRYYKISYSLVVQREKKQNWNIVKAITTPVKRKTSN